MSLLGDLDRGVALGARGNALDLADDLALGVGFAGNELGVVVALRVDNLEEARVGGLVGLLNGGDVSNLLDLGVCRWHLWLCVYVCVLVVCWCGEDRLVVCSGIGRSTYGWMIEEVEEEKKERKREWSRSDQYLS